MTTAQTLRLRVHRTFDEAEGIRSFELRHPEGLVLPPFEAGAHIDVYVPSLTGRADVIRQYSLCSSPNDRDRYLVAVLREAKSRGGSEGMFTRVSEGDVLDVSVPRNLFPLVEHAPHSLLLAGGIGITPIMCMAEHLAEKEKSFEMHVCTRSPARAPFQDRLRQAPFSGKVSMHFDDGLPDQRIDFARLLAAQPLNTHLYVCGPTGYIEAVLKAAQASGWPEDRVHREFFGAAPQPSVGGGEFVVRLQRSGREVRVGASESVAEALVAAGVNLAISCEQGVCGTCMTTVLSGTPDHRDLILTEAERAANDCFTPCCSRSLTPELVIDL